MIRYRCGDHTTTHDAFITLLDQNMAEEFLTYQLSELVHLLVAQIRFR